MRLLLLLLGCANAAVHSFDWTIGWKSVNPDGLKDRLVVSINDQWPLPVVRVSKGDRVEVTVHNNLTNPARNSSIHFHGLYQNGTNDMDGPNWVTQCPGVPGSTFVYNFTVDQTGTYWYHTHVTDLYPDGYRQLFLVDEDDAWFEPQVDAELAFSLSDWYHELTEVISKTEFFNLYNPTGAEPVPRSQLFNDTVEPRFAVEPSTTYRLRVANTGAFTPYYFYIPGHNVTIVEVDGVYTEPASAAGVYITPAQRYSLLFTTSDDPAAVYQMAQVVDSSMYDVVTPDVPLNKTAWLYAPEATKPQFSRVTHEDIYYSGLVDTDAVSLDEFDASDINVYDDFDLVPYDRMELLPGPDVEHVLNLEMMNLYDGKSYAFFNGLTWTPAKVPTLYTALDAPDDDTALNATIYGSNTNTFVLNHLDVVQLVLNNDDDGKHPFHLHGHNFQVVQRGPEYEEYTPWDPLAPHDEFPAVPMRRDTVLVNGNSHFVLRFRADNPGVWFFHCHVDWHMTQGLAVEFVEAPVQLRQNHRVHPIPNSSWETCRLGGIPSRGNAAGHTSDFFDLSGENRQVKNLPPGFTTKGYVAMAISVLVALTGLGFLSWLALSDTEKDETDFAEVILNQDIPSNEVQGDSFRNEEAESTSASTPLLERS